MKRFPNAFGRLLSNLIGVTFLGLPWIHKCKREPNHDGPCSGWVCDSIRKKVKANERAA